MSQVQHLGCVHRRQGEGRDGVSRLGKVFSGQCQKVRLRSVECCFRPYVVGSQAAAEEVVVDLLLDGGPEGENLFPALT